MLVAYSHLSACFLVVSSQPPIRAVCQQAAQVLTPRGVLVHTEEPAPVLQPQAHPVAVHTLPCHTAPEFQPGQEEEVILKRSLPVQMKLHKHRIPQPAPS